MLVKSALTAALAATAHSFLVPPDVFPADSALAEVAPFDPFQYEHAITVECPGCPVSKAALEGSDPAFAADVPNRLDMVFSIDASPAGDRLLANGFELFPNPDPFTAPLAAPHVSGAVVEGHMVMVSESEALGYQLQVYPLAEDAGAQFIAVDLKILEVGGVFVDDVPLVKVLLGKKGDALAIMDIATVQSTGRPADECTTFMCRVRAFFSGMTSSFKRPCPGKMETANGLEGPPHHGPPHHGPPPPHDGPPHHGPPHDGPPRHGRPHHGPPHGKPHDKPHHPHFSRPEHTIGVLSVILMIVTRLVLPIVLGVFVGVFVGLIAMTFISAGQALCAAFGGRKSQPKSHKADATEAVIVDEEKAGLMEGQEHVEPPPSYTDETATPRS